MNNVDALVGSRTDATATKHRSSLYSLFWALCGALVLVAFAGGATVAMTSARDRGFDVARATWLDPAASQFIGGSRAADEAANSQNRSASRVVGT